MKFNYPVPVSTLAFAALCLTSSVASAQSILLTADDFVLLGGTAVTVGGAGPNTFSNGDVGSAASISGFPPATIVNGTTILGGAIVGQALVDLGSARDKLNALVVDPANNLTGQDLGGMTLTPGVYGFDVAAEITLAGTKILMLDAQGKNNVTWVINIGTTLTTAAGAQVQFINLGSNGGADNGLFWNAGTSITFGADNIIAGNYLAAENITFGTALPAVGSGSGRALAHQIVSFDGQATMDALGGPGGGDMTGGLALNDEGELITSGYVLLSADGVYSQGVSSVILRPGNVYNTPGVVIDGDSADADPGVAATLTIFNTIATLEGTNTYTGGTFIDAGRLTASSANLPEDGSVTFIDSNDTGVIGELIFDQPDDGTFGGDITGDGLLVKNDAGALTLTGANTYTGGTTVNGGSLIVSTASLPGDVALANDSALVFDQADNGTFAGIISGDGTLTKENTGTLTLTGINTYSGTTTVTGGTLALADDGTLGNDANALVIDGGTLDLGATAQTVGAVSLGDSGQINNGTLTGASYASTGGTVGAALAGEDVVFTNTSGTTTLTGANTYGGGTVVTAGMLVVNTASLPADTVSVAADSFLVFNQAADGSFNGVISGAGSLTKNNVGALTLTGANTYSGGTTVNGGMLIADTTSLPAGSNVVLANGTGLVLDQAVNGSFGGVVSGAGSLTKSNAGVLTLTAANTHTGGTTVDAGTLAVSGAGTLGAATGALAVNDATLDLGATTQTVGAVSLNGGTIENGTLNGSSYTSAGGSIAAIITGEGVVFTNTAGVTVLTGANTYTGGTVITGGSIVTNSASLPSAQNMTLGPDGRLVLDQPVDVTFNGMVSGTGTIEKQGAGALTMSNDTTAAIDIQAGSFILDDTTVGSTTLAAGTFLRGNGTINGNLVNAGTVSPGFSPGVIIVAGNFTQTAGGTLVMEIASSVSFDQLIIAGTADLDGTLQIDLLDGFEPVGEDFTILTAAGGVSGVFTPVTGSAALTAEVTYGANDVVVTFAQTEFVVFAGTPNQMAVAAAAQQSPELTTALNGVPLASQMPAALNALSPQGYQVWSDIAFAHTASLAERLRHQPHAVEGQDDVYFEAGQSRGRIHGDLDVNSTHYTSESGLVGMNHAIGPNLTIGGFFDYTETNAGLGSAGSSTEVESKMPGVRAAWKQGAWFANAAVGFGFDDYESTRQINFPGTAATAESKTEGRHWVMDVSGGRRFLVGPASFSPFAGLQASGWKTDGFTETGAGALNATVASQSSRSLRTQLGMEVALDFAVGTASVRPHVRGAWVHELDNDQRTMNASFGAINYGVETREPQRDSARLSAGVDVAFSPTVALYADYSMQTGSRTRVSGEWRAGLSIGF